MKERVVTVAETLLQKKAELEALKLKVDTLQKQITGIERGELPDLMAELGFKSFALDDGTQINIVEDVTASITAGNKEQAHQWLIDNGFAGLIKTEVALTFNRGAHTDAVAAFEELRKKYDAKIKEGVHHSTFKAFVKEQMKEGKELPATLFGVYPFSIAKITK